MKVFNPFRDGKRTSIVGLLSILFMAIITVSFSQGMSFKTHDSNSGSTKASETVKRDFNRPNILLILAKAIYLIQ
ncbi:hypothetical protein ACOKFD_08000 [Flagellimonas sp. S174]|uniref:hypothetical protein n=1 Tax=Flagellimonas sp. S174 TaxID=3410790 RepID=UPI003BF4B4F5